MNCRTRETRDGGDDDDAAADDDDDGGTSAVGALPRCGDRKLVKRCQCRPSNSMMEGMITRSRRHPSMAHELWLTNTSRK